MFWFGSLAAHSHSAAAFWWICRKLGTDVLQKIPQDSTMKRSIFITECVAQGRQGGVNSFFQKMSKIQHFLDKNWVLSLRKIFLSRFGWFLDIPVGPGASKRHFLRNPVLTLGVLFSTVWAVSAFGYSPKWIYLGMKTLRLLLYTFQPHWSTFLAQLVTQGHQGGGGAVIGFYRKFIFFFNQVHFYH